MVKFEFLALAAVCLVVFSAVARGVVFGDGAVGMPPAEMRPMRPKHVGVIDLPVRHDICLASNEIDSLFGSDRNLFIVKRERANHDVLWIIGKQRLNVVHRVSSSVAERRSLISWQYLDHSFSVDSSRRCLADVRDPSGDGVIVEAIDVRRHRVLSDHPHPRPGAKFKLAAHDGRLFAGTIGLPFYLSQRDERKDGEYYSGHNPDKADYADNPLAPLTDWAITLFGLVIGGYCWWQANYRLDGRESWWLFGIACALALFSYGICLVTNRALKSVQRL